MTTVNHGFYPDRMTSAIAKGSIIPAENWLCLKTGINT